MLDKYRRKIDYLRISIIDKCNLKCIYCMPEESVESIEKDELITFEEIERICIAAAEIGIKKIKITGGEPLIRKEVAELVKKIKLIKGIENVTLTTNGILLEKNIEELAQAGIDGINISLDSLKEKKYHEITRCGYLKDVLSGIESVVNKKIKLKLNCVIIKNINEDEIIEIAGLAQKYPIDVRFIELMPIGYGKEFSSVSNEVIKGKLETYFGKLILSETTHGNGPAEYFDINGFKGSVGFISALSHIFCDSCNRIRITCDGSIKLCLNYDNGLNVKEKIRSGISNDELKDYLYHCIIEKPLYHGFNESKKDSTEHRKMIQIGG